MSVRNIIIALVIIAATPASSFAAASCRENYDKCLNDTWNTSGVERYLADLACATLYNLCLRRSVA